MSEMMVHFKTTQFKPLRQLFESMKSNISDVNICFYSTHMEIIQKDPYNSFNLNVKLIASNFEEYYCAPDIDDVTGSELGHEINLSLETIVTFFKSSSTSTSMLEFIIMAGRDHVEFSFINKDGTQVQATIGTQVKVDETDEIPIIGDPDEYPISLAIKSAALKDILTVHKNAKAASITIYVDTNVFIVSSDKTYKCSYKVDLSDRSVVDVAKMPNDYVVEMRYHFNLLFDFVKANSSQSSMVRIYLKHDDQIIISCMIGTLGEMKLSIPPMVETDMP